MLLELVMSEVQVRNHFHKKEEVLLVKVIKEDLKERRVVLLMVLYQEI